jgi:hypothetical protein
LSKSRNKTERKKRKEKKYLKDEGWRNKDR